LTTLSIFDKLWENQDKKKLKPLCLATEGFSFKVYIAMEYYTKQIAENQENSPKNREEKAFWLTFQLLGIGAEWLDAGLPTPHYLRHHSIFHQYIAAWAIVGYFGSPKAKAFLLDVVARFLLAFPDAERLPWRPEIREDGHRLNAPPYELKELAAALPSLPWDHSDTKLASFVDAGVREVNVGRDKNDRMVSEDALFEATRWHLYRRAYAEGHTRNITVDYVRVLLETENQLLAHRRDPSDIRTKANRMAEYMQNEFVIYDNIEGYAEWSKEKRAEYMREYRQRKGLVMATREEHIKQVNAAKQAKTKAEISAILQDVFVQDQIKKKNGKLNAAAIARILKRDPDTVRKHLKEMGLI